MNSFNYGASQGRAGGKYVASLINLSYREYNYIQESEGDEKEDQGEALIIERPRSWRHLFYTLYSVDEFKLFKL